MDLPSLHSISSSLLVSLMFLNIFPLFKVSEEPLTLRSFMTVTESPSLNFVPLLSFALISSVMAKSKNGVSVVSTRLTC